MKRDREELTFGLIALLAFPLLAGLFPQFLLYLALLGAVALLIWLIAIGAGLVFFHFLPWCWQMVTRVFAGARVDLR